MVDLGLDCVYMLNLKRQAVKVKTFGSTGQLRGEFRDPAGLAVDREFNMLVADSRNHRVQLWDGWPMFLGFVEVGNGPMSWDLWLTFQMITFTLST